MNSGVRILIISRAVSLGLRLGCRRYEMKGPLENPRNTLSLRERPHTGHHEAKVKGWCWRRVGPFRGEESLALSEPANPSETPGLGVTRGLPAQQSSHPASREATLQTFGGHKGPRSHGPCTPGTHSLAGGTDHARVAAVLAKDCHAGTHPPGQINSYIVTLTAEGMLRRGAADVGRGGSWHALQRR